MIEPPENSIHPATRAEWRAWLAANHARAQGVWMIFYKAAAGKPRTGWSRPNKERVERLIAAGLMAPAGQAKIDVAQQDGSWNALDAVEDLTIPLDLEDALAAYPSARGHFEAFPRSVKRGILEWIASAKTPATRAKRVAEIARLAEENIRANQWRR